MGGLRRLQAHVLEGGDLGVAADSISGGERAEGDPDQQQAHRLAADGEGEVRRRARRVRHTLVRLASFNVGEAFMDVQAEQRRRGEAGSEEHEGLELEDEADELGVEGVAG